VRGTCRRGKYRVIDHFVVCPAIMGPSLSFPHYVFVDYSWDISDHFHVFASLALWVICSNITAPLPCSNACLPDPSLNRLG
jgi:hypothetical protein